MKSSTAKKDRRSNVYLPSSLGAYIKAAETSIYEEKATYEKRLADKSVKNLNILIDSYSVGSSEKVYMEQFRTIMISEAKSLHKLEKYDKRIEQLEKRRDRVLKYLRSIWIKSAPAGVAAIAGGLATHFGTGDLEASLLSGIALGGAVKAVEAARGEGLLQKLENMADDYYTEKIEEVEKKKKLENYHIHRRGYKHVKKAHRAYLKSLPKKLRVIKSLHEDLEEEVQKLKPPIDIDSITSFMEQVAEHSVAEATPTALYNEEIRGLMALDLQREQKRQYRKSKHKLGKEQHILKQ